MTTTDYNRPPVKRAIPFAWCVYPAGRQDGACFYITPENMWRDRIFSGIVFNTTYSCYSLTGRKRKMTCPATTHQTRVHDSWNSRFVIVPPKFRGLSVMEIPQTSF